MMKPSTASPSHYTCFFLHGKVRSNSKTMAWNHRKKSRQFYRRKAARRKHHLVGTTLEKIFVLLTVLPCSQNKNRYQKMDRVRHNNFRLSKLVGKHSNADCNPFGKLWFFRQNNYAILLTLRWKIRSKPYSNFKTCTKSNTNRRSFNLLFRRSFSSKRCRKMA